MKTSKGRIVSKKKHAQGLKQFNKPGVKQGKKITPGAIQQNREVSP
jgi:hypothetical protein